MKWRQNVLFALLVAAALSQSVSFVDDDSAKRVPILHNGRIKPFDAFARQTLKTISGSDRWKGRTATSVLIEAIEAPQALNEREWVRVDYEGLKTHLGLPKERRFFSLKELEEAFPKIDASVKSAKAKRDRDERPSKLEQRSELLYTQIRTAQNLISGESLKGYPASGASKLKIETEVLYLNAKPLQAAACAYFLSFFLLVVFKTGSIGRSLGIWAAGLALCLHTLGISARVIVLSRPPVSNMYESMIFMNWALMVFAAVFSLLKKNAAALTMGAFVSAVVMLYGDLLPIDASLEVLVPVLRSNYWLSVHVMTVVSSYGAFGLAMALGHRHLLAVTYGRFSSASGGQKEEAESADLITRVIQLGVILIGMGTFLGGVWANESWGRFWGWDPKETWALITFLGYLAVVHLVYTKKISHFILALCSVLGFLLVLMTWYGVNFVLGRGLHSYGAGTGGMIWVIYYLIFEALFVGFILLRKKSVR